MVTEFCASQDTRCPVCDGENAKDIFSLESPYLEKLFYRIRVCCDCEHRYAVGPVTEQIFSEVYSAVFHASSQQLADSPLAAVMLNAKGRAQWLDKCGMQGKLLDVGAGRGYFVKAAQTFFDARGIDYSPDAARYGQALGVPMDSGDFILWPYEGGSFDVLTLWDVLAGMVDVRATMIHAAKLLRPGGYAVLTVPMGDSLVCRLSGKRWPLWIPPVNLHYFSKKSLESLLQQCGFEIVQMECQGKWVSLNFLFVKLARSFGLRDLEHAMAKFPIRQAVPINLGDIKTVVVRSLRCTS